MKSFFHFKWIPNLFTFGNLLLGFYAILITLTYHHNPELLKVAGFLIILAALLDGMDGFFARLLRASSEIGAQLDSLADLTTFGVAPAVLFYSIFFQDMHVGFQSFSIPLGILLAGIYPASAAFRLARFNVHHSEDSFDGLPSPIAGLVIALIPLMTYELEVPIPNIVFIVIFFLLSYLMVSTLKYSKIQVSIFRRFTRFRAILFLVSFFMIMMFIHIKFGTNISASVLFILILIYVFSGIISFVIHLIQIKKL
ncbi:MAG: CDP-diacylglycerol--serine O-phosphatidyltransferase [Leptospiraceae bacterium]|nr:CDP-diacylglycerol--serine O-phosphatidyltransferase [Leptospiraceae bacterium]MDW7975801.1 CDP-diacylglycerol--serine O-phosphatidyltransferase [Leptospiraceae bacterium]